MPENEFLLPDELGWEANDEVTDLVNKSMAKIGENVTGEGGIDHFTISVGVAQMIDDIYALIKKYQKENNNG